LQPPPAIRSMPRVARNASIKITFVMKLGDPLPVTTFDEDESYDIVKAALPHILPKAGYNNTS
jgi:hypothetical protein